MDPQAVTGRHEFPFLFEHSYERAAAIFGIRPTNSLVVVDDGELTVRFGPWLLRTPLAQVTGTELSGPYGLAKTMGPARLSFADRGLSCITNRHRGLCIRFARPLPGIDPLGLIRHPGVTVTVADPEALAAILPSGG